MSQAVKVAVTDEWGLGQAIPLNKPFLKTTHITKVAQLGVIGYDQAQVSRNTSSNTIVDAYERLVPFITPMPSVCRPITSISQETGLHSLSGEHEYSAKAALQGDTIVFGFTYTFRFPKPTQKATP